MFSKKKAGGNKHEKENKENNNYNFTDTGYDFEYVTYEWLLKKN